MDALDLDRRAKTARTAERLATRDLAAALRDIDDARAFYQLGYAALAEYAEVELGLTARRTRVLVAFARRLDHLPVLAAAIDRGEVDWTKAREVLRVATPDSDAAWTLVAATRTSREVEDLVRQARDEDAAKAPARERLVLLLDATDARTIRRWLAAARAATGDADVDAGVLLASLCAADLERAPVAEAPSGERYRVHLQVCPERRITTAVEHDVSEEAAGEAACDAEVVDLTGGARHGHLTRAVPPATRRAVVAAHGGGCGIPSCRNHLWVDVHHIVSRARGGTHAAENLIPLCTWHSSSAKFQPVVSRVRVGERTARPCGTAAVTVHGPLR